MVIKWASPAQMQIWRNLINSSDKRDLKTQTSISENRMATNANYRIGY